MDAMYRPLGEVPSLDILRPSPANASPMERSRFPLPRGPAATGVEASHPRVLISVPVRNEAPRLAASILELVRVLDRSGLAYRLAVAEDGSTDGSQKVLAELRERLPSLLVQESPRALGRGRALRMLWSKESADVYCFTDADLAAGAEAVVTAVRRVLAGEEVVVGSRYAPGAQLSHPPVRSLVSQAYNRLLRLTFEEPIQDHQCGLKAFSASTVHRLLPLSREDSWFWDTEMLILAHRAGIPVVEMPVVWTETKVKRTRWGRLASDIYLHWSGLLRLRARLDEERARSRPVPTSRSTPNVTNHTRS